MNSVSRTVNTASRIPELCSPTRSLSSYLVPRILALILAITVSSAVAAVQPSPAIPIVAYLGVPVQESNVSRFREFRDAGFDISICFYHDTPVDTLLRILDDAKKCDVQLIISSGWVSVQPHVGVPRIKDHPALYGYFIRDEPNTSELPETARRCQGVWNYDIRKPCYVNLLPDYGDASRREVGVTDYQHYVRQAAALLAPPAASTRTPLSFDFYPIQIYGIRSTWYSTLEAFRAESIRSGRPLWAFVLCTPHGPYPQPTLPMLRLQIYSDLAYGARAIQYFTYWCPKADSQYTFYNAPISLEGKRTATYKLVQSMNRELRTLLPLFEGADVTAVGHLVTIPAGCRRFSNLPLNIRSLKVAGSQGALLSTMKKGNSQYLVIVNKDYEKSLRVDLRANSPVRQITKQLKAVDTKKSYKIAGGDILIFRLN